ncbi:MAG: AraC family transcriptional regulator [Oscillospiraceae bacterium]|nr:AraC family transcriptional regulator [Oscillospiraceae bacterium]
MERAGYLEENYHYFHLRDTAGQERDFHFHEFDKLVILIEGRVTYLVESEDYLLQPRDILLVRRHCIHKAVIDRSEPYERIILYLDRNFFERALPEARLTDCFDRADLVGRHLLSPDREQWEKIQAVLKSFEDCRGDEAGVQAMRDTLVMQLLIHVGRLAPGNDAGERQTDPKIQETLSYIAENLGGDLSVDALAGRVWLSRYHFMRLFRAQTGQSVHAYVRQKRLLRAARLIREGTAPAKAAELCGYTDYSGFHRAFVQSFGCTPGRIRAGASGSGGAAEQGKSEKREV